MKNALLVPGVFFLNFFLALVFFSFFGGLALRYSMSVAQSDTGFFFFLCMIKKACYMLPAVTVMGIIAVYNFLMRHRAQLYLAVALFILCLLVTLLVIIPVFYAQLASINELLGTYTITPADDSVLSGFLGYPAVLTELMRDIDILFYDLYHAYTRSFFSYAFFVCAVFFSFCSIWIACTATRWKMVNLLLLFIFARIHIFVYPFVHHEAVHAILGNISAAFSDSVLAVPFLLMLTGLLLHVYGVLKLLLTSAQRKKRRAA